jgi:hypothetical protein
VIDLWRFRDAGCITGGPVGVFLESAESELVRDMLAIVTSFAGRLYGQRSAKTKRLRAAVSTETECGDAA